jgi:hypothetical protein
MPTIEFDVPYFFEAQYVPKGKRKPVPGKFGGLMKVEIECATSAEAVLAVTVSGNDGFRDRFECMYVEFDGEFFARKTSDPEVRIAAFTADHLNVHNCYDIARFNNGGISEQPDGEFYSIEGYYDDKRGQAAIEARREQVREAARSIIFVDGTLHRRSQLPTIKSSIEYRMSGNDVIHIALGQTDENSGGHAMMFGIGDLASAEAWANDRAEREPDTVIYKDIAVDIHMPHLLPRSDILAREMIRVGQFQLNDNLDLKKQPDDVITQWVIARRAFKEAATHLDETAITEMLETWQRFFEVYEVSENTIRSGYDSSYRASDDIRYQALMGAFEIWENRPILDPDAAYSMSSPKVAP